MKRRVPNKLLDILKIDSLITIKFGVGHGSVLSPVLCAIICW